MAKATAFTASAASRLKISFVAAPKVIVTWLVNVIAPVMVAVRFLAPIVPVSLTFLPTKSATPATASMATALFSSVPPMVALLEVKVTVVVESATVLPSWSWMVTTG